MLGEQTEEQIGYSDKSDKSNKSNKSNFIRAPETGGWICETDLSREQIDALYERIHEQANEPTR